MFEGDDDLARIVLLIQSQSPNWVKDAACKEHPEITFVSSSPSRAVQLNAAKEAADVCHDCLVRAECLAYALEHRIEGGVWGGLASTPRLALSAQYRGAHSAETPCLGCGAMVPGRNKYCGVACGNAYRARVHRRRKSEAA